MARPENKALISKEQAIADIKYLLTNVAPEHREPGVVAPIKKSKGYKPSGIRENDAYLLKFLNTLDAKDLQELHKKIIKNLHQQGPAKGSTTANALYYVVFGQMPDKKPLNTQEQVEALFSTSFKVIGNEISKKYENELQRQYDAENKVNMGRALEEAELKVCGKLYADLLRNYLDLIDEPERSKFNTIIRELILEYKKDDANISIRHFGLCLSYVLTKLTFVLDNKGYITKANDLRDELRKEMFRGVRLQRDALRNVFTRKNKEKSKKIRPTITQEILENSHKYWNVVKSSLTSFKSFLGLGDDDNITIDQEVLSANQDLVPQLADVMQKIDACSEPNMKEELQRRFLNRVENIRYYVEKLHEDAILTQKLGDNKQKLNNLPANKEFLTNSFTLHLMKLRNKVNPLNVTDKSYIPRQEKGEPNQAKQEGQKSKL